MNFMICPILLTQCDPQLISPADLFLTRNKIGETANEKVTQDG